MAMSLLDPIDYRRALNAEQSVLRLISSFENVVATLLQDNDQVRLPESEQRSSRSDRTAERRMCHDFLYQS